MNKSKWPRGPWDEEADSAEFESSGLPCRIRRHSVLGHLCGYVGIPQSHPWYGKAYGDDIETPAEIKTEAYKGGVLPVVIQALSGLPDDRCRIDCALNVHGGITYAKDHNPIDAPEGYWWFGFDCCHSDDYIPGAALYGDGEDYRDFAYVRAETEEMARKLAAAAEEAVRP